MPEDPSMELPATPDSVRTARRFVAERVRACPPEVVADAVLLTSELCTNSVVHARTNYVVRVVTDEARLRVEVDDGEPDLPRAGEGRGMLLVALTADDWGAEPRPDGKVVWFELRR